MKNIWPSDQIFLFVRTSYQLDVYAFNLISLDSFAAQVRFDHCDQFVVYHISECVVFVVVEMYVLECVHIKIHLVVGAVPVVVDTQHRHVSQYVIH